MLVEYVIYISLSRFLFSSLNWKHWAVEMEWVWNYSLLLLSVERPPSSSWLFCRYGACWVCVCCINPPNSDMDHGIFNVRTDVTLMHAIAHWGVRTPKESLHWKLTQGRKIPCRTGNRTCLSGVPVRRSASRATSPPSCQTEHETHWQDGENLPGRSQQTMDLSAPLCW